MTRERDQQKFPSGHVVPFVSLLLCTWLGTIGPGTAQQTPTAPAPTSVVVPGTVQAFYATDLFAKESGYVSQISADIGDQVKKNQVLAVIEDPELQQQLLRSRAAVQQAAAALDVAKRRLTGLQADRALQQATLRRSEQLFAGKAVTGQQLDEQRAKEGVSAANLGVGQADVALAEANLQAANADLQRLQAMVEYTKIIAPFDGVITRRLVNLGDLVQAATANRPTAPLFTCQETDVVRVFAEVPETNAAAVRPGWAAEVRLYGPTGQTLHNTVTRVAGALEPTTRTMRVEIDLPNPDGSLLPGMYAQVTLSPPPDPVEATVR
jgi:multidrug efflux pump subunit AcrA (membrane-fusion protein)